MDGFLQVEARVVRVLGNVRAVRHVEPAGAGGVVHENQPRGLRRVRVESARESRRAEVGLRGNGLRVLAGGVQKAKGEVSFRAWCPGCKQKKENQGMRKAFFGPLFLCVCSTREGGAGLSAGAPVPHSFARRSRGGGFFALSPTVLLARPWLPRNLPPAGSRGRRVFVEK